MQHVAVDSMLPPPEQVSSVQLVQQAGEVDLTADTAEVYPPLLPVSAELTAFAAGCQSLPLSTCAQRPSPAIIVSAVELIG